nr:immunoglobulin light chain junction region [Macaca mulatta]
DYYCQVCDISSEHVLF